MALWRGMRYPKSPSVAAADEAIADTLISTGYDWQADMNKNAYDSQMSAAKAEQIRRENQLWLRLDAAAPEERKPIFDEEITSGTYTKAVTAGMSGPALRDMQNALRTDKALLEGRYERWSRQKDSQDNVINFNAALTEYDNTDAKDAMDLVKRSSDLEEMAMGMLETGDHPDLQTPDQVKEFLDKKESSWLMSFLLANPHKVDENGKIIEEDYWIDHPNEFAKQYNIGTNLDRDLLSTEELADLKSKYVTIKNNAKRIDSEQRELRHDKNGREFLARLWDDDPNNQPTPQEIANAIKPENDLITESQGKYLISIVSDTSGKKFNLEKYNEVKEANLNYQMNPSKENKQKALNKLYENSKYLDTEGKTLLNELYSDIGRAEAADKQEAYSDMASILGGAPDLTTLGNFLFQRDKDREAWILAKIRWDDEIQKLKDVDKSIKRKDKRLLAVKIARQVAQEIKGKSPEEFLPLEEKKKSRRTQWKFGLDEIWDSLNGEDKKKAVELLDKGYSPEQLITHYRNKTK